MTITLFGLAADLTLMIALGVGSLIIVFGLGFAAFFATRRFRDSHSDSQGSGTRHEFTDGNGRTQHQRDYLSELRVKKAQRDLEAADKSHVHKGESERYDPIVGSLGEVNDEGCDELDGVRLLEHDESYCDDESHAETKDFSELRKAIVFGEVFNDPRFKSSRRKR